MSIENPNEKEISEERVEEIKEFLSGLLSRQITEYEEHVSALKGEQGSKMWPATRSGQIENTEREIELCKDTLKHYSLDEE